MTRLVFLNIFFAALLLFSGAAFAQNNLAVMDSRLSQMEQEIRQLTGKIEEQSYKIKKLEGELERRLSDAELRISDLEKRPVASVSPTLAPSPSQNTVPQQNTVISAPVVDQSWETTPPQVSVQKELGQVGTASDDATQAYEQAFATLRNGNYDLAEQQFQAFLDQYPGNNLENNAQYWLAETYYVRNQYDRAAKGFATAYQNNPAGSKAPDNLLKLGLSLAGLGKKEDACVALSHLMTDFANGPRSILSRAEIETTRLGCAL
ncbi:MAG: tol-pal system protein YbgF [Rhodospirillales bacterium]|nr:tol-pal system protein YbgF [Rhodospirillales bacterium]MCB9980707.1 tol-pal system protein YbgF [Rhodospirillales bacterium]